MIWLNILIPRDYDNSCGAGHHFLLIPFQHRRTLLKFHNHKQNISKIFWITWKHAYCNKHQTAKGYLHCQREKILSKLSWPVKLKWMIRLMLWTKLIINIMIRPATWPARLRQLGLRFLSRFISSVLLITNQIFFRWIKRGLSKII